MAIIKCKMCGGDIDLSADKTFGTCEFCGSIMTFPKVSDEQRAAAFNRGNHFRRIGEFDKALAVYEQIVHEDNTDAEAHWCCALCRFGIEYVEDPNTYEWIPTCHRASFDSFLEDVDYKAAVEYSDGVTRRQYMKDATKIAEVQRGILATSQNEDPFDVFICYKESDEDGNRTRDSIMAQDIYYQLTEQGHRVFFSRITLEDKVGTQYEPYIFAALNSAKVMVVVGTKPEHLNAVWVKNEWSRFLALIRKDRSKVILPCYRDMDPYDLPEQLSVLQSFDMGKIGFIQDLIRGVDKVLKSGQKPPVQETVVIQQTAPQTSGTSADAFLRRGYLALEDKEWEVADSFFEEVLNRDAENAEAYLGKALVKHKCSSLSSLIKYRLSKTEEAARENRKIAPNREHIQRQQVEYEIPGFLSKGEIANLYAFNQIYTTQVPDRKKQRLQEESFWHDHKQLSKAVKFAKGDFAKTLQQAYQELLRIMDERIAVAEHEENQQQATQQNEYTDHIAQADLKLNGLYESALQKREKRYQENLLVLQAGESVEKLASAADAFRSLGDYKDSIALSEECTKRQKEELERKIEADKKRAAKDSLIAKLKLGLFLFIFIAILLWVSISISNNNEAKLSAFHDEIIGITVSCTESIGSGYVLSNGEMMERTIITFVDKNQAEITHGKYQMFVRNRVASFSEVEIYLSDTLPYSLSITSSGKIVLSMNDEQFELKKDSDGIIRLLTYEN